MTGIEAVCQRMATAKRVLVITGAGLSADSGLPVYRGFGGLYHDAACDDGTPIEQALSGEMLQRNPELIWRILTQISRAAEHADFNRGHQVLQEMERFFGEMLVFTQNVDGLHCKAGSRMVAEVHGSLAQRRCLACGSVTPAPERIEEVLPPRCDSCGGVLRPTVVLFGEKVNLEAIAALERFLEGGVDLCLSIGTSSQFPYVTEPVFRVIQQGGFCVEVNPETTDLSPFFHQCLRGSASAVLDQLWDRFLGVDLTLDAEE